MDSKASTQSAQAALELLADSPCFEPATRPIFVSPASNATCVHVLLEALVPEPHGLKTASALWEL
jgi:hypothetical protein